MRYRVTKRARVLEFYNACALLLPGLHVCWHVRLGFTIPSAMEEERVLFLCNVSLFLKSKIASKRSLNFLHTPLGHHRFLVIFNSSSSSSRLHLQVIFIFKSSSSLDLDHHWNIITGYGSSLDIYHHCWIIITGAISWFFSSQEFIQSQPFFMLVVGLASM